MKRFCIFILTLCILLTGFSSRPVLASSGQTGQSESETEEQAQILPSDKVSTKDIVPYSAAMCVMDAATGQVLYYKNMDVRHYPASTTKIMTALLLIEDKKLSDTITFTDDCYQGINIWTDMNIAMKAGEKLTVEQALYAMLLTSANEVCTQAAIYDAGSVQAFAEKMNRKAGDLGCSGTHFANANGLHDKNHYTTARDLALIARAAIQNDTFRKVTGTRTYQIKTNLRPEGFDLYAKHQMLMDTKHHYDSCIGGKTGYTREAKNTLVTYASKDGTTLICTAMYTAGGHIYDDTQMALDYCFSHFDRAAIDKMAAAQPQSQTAETEPETETAAPRTPSDPIVLQEPETQSTAAAPAAGPGPGARLAASAAAYAGKASQLFLDNLPTSFFVLAGALIVLSLILIWLRGAARRSRHRRRYRQNRRKHAQEKDEAD